MKLVFAIVNDQDGTKVLDALNKNGFSVTKLATTGGFLRVGNMTLIIGTEEDKVQQVIDIISEKSRKRKQLVVSPMAFETLGATARATEVDVGGATVFVIDVERFERL